MLLWRTCAQGYAAVDHWKAPKSSKTVFRALVHMSSQTAQTDQGQALVLGS